MLAVGHDRGIFASKPFTDFTKDDFDEAIAVNVGGFFHTTQAVIGQMLMQGDGHIVNITTSMVDQPDARVPAVLASITKGGLQSVSKRLALEYADRGIRVNAISPGLIKTPMHPAAYHETMAGMHPLGRMGETEEIADAIVYLDNAKFVTGEILHVDSGQRAGR